MCSVSETELRSWGDLLRNSQTPLVERFRALWGLKHAKEDLAIDMIAEAFSSKSELLKHELAYCLGQKKNKHAIKVLSDLVQNENQEPIVRHEAGEALAAIGDFSVMNVLEKYSTDINKDVAETCHLGLSRLNYIKSNDDLLIEANDFDTVDPAPEYPADKYSLVELENILMDPKIDIFERYRAMFSLRKIANSTTEEKDSALDIICNGLNCQSSALFRHEISFVLGQLADPRSVASLIANVANVNESGMVRHESAEALGAIGTDECKEFLAKYLNDPIQVVAESCIVALDMAEYNSSENFTQYAMVPESMK